MLLRPSVGRSPGSANLGTRGTEGSGKGNPFAGKQREDPALAAMRFAGLNTSGKELTVKKEINEVELEEKPSDIAKKTFQEHGLDFEYVANKVHDIMNSSEPQVQLKALEMVNRILLKSEDEDEEMKKLLERANTPSVVINISSPYSPEARNQLDILIPS